MLAIGPGDLLRSLVDALTIKKINGLITSRFDGYSARIDLDEIKSDDDPWRSDVANLYRGAGWKVEVEKPAYGSSAREALVFSVKHLH